MSDRRIEYVPLADLIPAERNPKTHDAATIKASMDRFGYVEPIVLDERTGRIVSGHGRWEDMRARSESGWSPPDGVRVDDDGAWHVAVVRGWASRDDAEALAAGVALNRIGERGGWNTSVLAEVLGKLNEQEGGTFGVGFGDDELAALLGKVAAAEVQLPPDRPPPTVQGVREVILLFQADSHREYLEHLARLTARWGEDVTGLAVLRAMKEAAEREMATRGQ